MLSRTTNEQSTEQPARKPNASVRLSSSEVQQMLRQYAPFLLARTS